jgi:hypothetical protein
MLIYFEISFGLYYLIPLTEFITQHILLIFFF